MSDCVSQRSFGFYEPAAQWLGAALAHSEEHLVQLLRLAQTWLRIPLIVREAIVTIAMNAT